MALELFDFVKVLFTDAKKYSTIRNSDKSRHFFMVQRFMSIKHPGTAQQLNRVGQNSWAVMDLWHLVARRYSDKTKRVPGWIYTKTKKVASEKDWKPDSGVAKFWMERNNIGERELADAIKFEPEKMKKLFTAIKKQMEMYD